jgi:tetratricopeptide (TPR) repeat protein
VTCTWLHISDFHVKTGDPYDRDVVLRALVAAVRRERESGRAPDVVFATGDVAFSGKSEEYALASAFFNDLLDAAGLDRGRLFVIAGNHDVDRDRGVGLARTLGSLDEGNSYFAPGQALPHLSLKQAAFLDWYEQYFAGIRSRPVSTCGPVEIVEAGDRRLAVLAINSALFSQDDNDHRTLLVGRRALDEPAHQLREADVDLRIVLIHHPVDWLSDVERSNIRTTLTASADVLLRGHLHETDVAQVVRPEGRLVHIAAGAAYQTRLWPNRALYVTDAGGQLEVFPLRYEDTPAERGVIDPTVFFDSPDYIGRVPIEPGPAINATFRNGPPAMQAEQPAATNAGDVRRSTARFRSNIASRRGLRVVGRELELSTMDSALVDPLGDRVLVLTGPPGVGKTELAREYARRHRDRYPGGTFALDATGAGTLVDLTRTAITYLDVQLPDGLTADEQCAHALAAIGSEATLLIYDNVQSFDAIERWLPPAGMPCHVIITSIAQPHGVGWTLMPVEPLTYDTSIELVAELAGPTVAKQYGAALAQRCEGLPVELCPIAAVLGDDHRRGRDTWLDLTQLSSEARQSFGLAYQHLTAPAQLLLQTASGLNPQRINTSQLHAHLHHGAGWSERDTTDAIDACVDLQLLRGSRETELTMHQLLTAYLISDPPNPDTRIAQDLATIRAHQREELLKAAGAVSEEPSGIAHSATLTSFNLAPSMWHTPEAPISVDDLDRAGYALSEIGQFALALPWFKQVVSETRQRGPIDHQNLSVSLSEIGICYFDQGKYEQALPWFEQAVKEKRQGDVDGRINHASLGASLHGVGVSYSRQGNYEQALGLFKQAVEERRQGDIHGRINHENLGVSLHEVGVYYSQQGEYDEALSWFEQAVDEARQGDVHGRINHESLGRSVNQLGLCYFEQGKYEEALPWFKQAVEEKRQGDVYGRLNHDTLGVSLHVVGLCYFEQGEYEEALRWLDQAVDEACQGDVHGRLNHENMRAAYLGGAACLRELGEHARAEEWTRRAGNGGGSSV